MVQISGRCLGLTRSSESGQFGPVQYMFYPLVLLQNQEVSEWVWVVLVLEVFWTLGRILDPYCLISWNIYFWAFGSGRVRGVPDPQSGPGFWFWTGSVLMFNGFVKSSFSRVRNGSQTFCIESVWTKVLVGPALALNIRTFLAALKYSGPRL